MQARNNNNTYFFSAKHDDNIDIAINGSAGFADFLYTFLRLWMVFSAVEEYGTTDSNDHPQSAYNKWVHGDTGAPPSHYWPHYTLEWALGFGVFIPLVIGGMLRYYQQKRPFETLKAAYQVDRINEVQHEPTPFTRQQLLHDYNALLARGKSRPQTKEREPAKSQEATASSYFTFENFAWIWGVLANTSLIFWITWVVCMVPFGINAVAAAPVLPAIMAFTTLFSLALHTPSLWKKKVNSQDKVAYRDDLIAKEYNRVTSELKQRLHAKKAYAAFKNRIKTLLQTARGERSAAAIRHLNNPEKIVPVDDAYTMRITQDDYLYLKKKRRIRDSEIRVAEQFDAAKKASILQGKLGRFVTKDYTFIPLINTVISQFAVSFFILWLLASTLTAIALVAPGTGIAAACIAISSVLGSNVVGTLVSAGMAFIFSYAASKDKAQKQQDHQQLLLRKLGEAYSTSDDSKLKVFEKRYENLQQLSREIAAYQLTLKNLPADQLTDIGKEILAFNTKETDVLHNNNQYYFENQKQPTNTTWIKKAANYAFIVLGGMQTGIFIARMLCLAGGPAAAACFLFASNPVTAFIAIAGGLALTVSYLRFENYSVNKERERQTAFLNSFDAKLSIMRKYEKEMEMLQDLIPLATKPARPEKPSSPVPAAVVAAPPANDRVVASSSPANNGIFRSSRQHRQPGQPQSVTQQHRAKHHRLST